MPVKGRDAPVRAFTFPMKKSAYLQQKSIPMLKVTEMARYALRRVPSARSMSRPDT